MKNIILLISSIYLTLVIGDIFLKNKFYDDYLKKYQIAEKQNVQFDKRSLIEVVVDERKKNENSWPPYHIVEYAEYLKKNEKNILPLSGISNSKLVYCNESGKWSILSTDRYGFPNPTNTVYKDIDIVLLGDSFTRGACVNENQTLRFFLNNYLPTISMGNGGSFYSYYATFVEYVKIVKPRFTIVNVYEGNDFNELNEESRTNLKNYILENNFSQNLIHKQKKINYEISKYFNLWLDSKISLYKTADSERETLSKFEIYIKSLKLSSIINLLIINYYDLKYFFANIPQEKDLRQILITMKKDVKSWNGELIINYIPSYEKIVFNKSDSYNYKNKFLKLCDEIGLIVVDFTNILKIETDIKKIYPLGIKGHFTEYGYKLLSEHIINEISKYN